MSSKFNIAPEWFLADVESLMRKNYAKIHYVRISRLRRSPDPESGAVEREALAREALTAPQEIAGLQSAHPDDYDEIIQDAMEMLATSSAAELSLTSEEHDRLAAQWLKAFGEGSEIKASTLELVTAWLKLKLRAAGGEAAVKRFTEGFEKDIENYSARAAALVLISTVLAQERYAYGRSSALETLIRRKEFILANPELFGDVVAHFAEHAKSGEAFKLARDLLRRAMDILADADRQDSGDKLDTALRGTLEKLIQALPDGDQPSDWRYLASEAATLAAARSSWQSFAERVSSRRESSQSTNNGGKSCEAYFTAS